MTGLWIVITLVLSTLNALGAGYAWPESKERGGLAHLVTWSVAIMASIGFTMVLTLFNLFVALSQHWITPEMAARGEALAFSLIAIPILGTGLVITLDAWAAYRRSRSLADLAVAGYDTWAQAHNTYVVVQHLGGAMRSAGGLFKGGGSSGGDADVDSDGAGALIVILLVLAAFIGGALITWGLVRVASDASEARMRMAVAPHRKW